MNIKYLFIAFALVIVYFQLNKTPSDEESLKSALTSFKAALVKKDAKVIIDYLYPALYADMLNKEEMLSKYKKNTTSNITDFQLTPTLPIKTYSDGLYSIVSYTKHITMDITLKNGNKRARNLGLMLLRSSLKEGDTLDIEKMSNTAYLKKSGTFIAIKEHQIGWKFIDIDAIPKRKLKKILHPDIIDEEQDIIIRHEDSYLLDMLSQLGRK